MGNPSIKGFKEDDCFFLADERFSWRKAPFLSDRRPATPFGRSLLQSV